MFSVPAGYDLPAYVQASGQVSGPVDNLEVQLGFFLPGQATFAKLNGTLRDVLAPDSLYLDLAIEELAIVKADILCCQSFNC